MIETDQIKAIGKVITGNWRGTIGNDTVEEVWSEPLANTMMGMFRWISENKIRFFELILIDVSTGKITIKIKHFNADFTGWEEKDGFVPYELVDLTNTKVTFGSSSPSEQGRLIYERKDKSKLVINLEMKDGRDLVFNLDLL